MTSTSLRYATGIKMFKKMLPTFPSRSPTGIPLFRVFGDNRRPSSGQKQRKASFFDQSKERCALQSTGAPSQAVGGAALEDSLVRGARRGGVLASLAQPPQIAVPGAASRRTACRCHLELQCCLGASVRGPRSWSVARGPFTRGTLVWRADVWPQHATPAMSKWNYTKHKGKKRLDFITQILRLLPRNCWQALPVTEKCHYLHLRWQKCGLVNLGNFLDTTCTVWAEQLTCFIATGS